MTRADRNMLIHIISEGVLIVTLISIMAWLVFVWPEPTPAPFLYSTDKSEIIRLTPAAMRDHAAQVNEQMEKRSKP